MNNLVIKDKLLCDDNGKIYVVIAKTGSWSTAVSSVEQAKKRMFDTTLIYMLISGANKNDFKRYKEYIINEYNIDASYITNDSFSILNLKVELIDSKEMFFIRCCEAQVYGYTYEEVVHINKINTFSFVPSSYRGDING